MSATRNEIERRLAAGPLVLDGATGTELERRGVNTAPPLWSARALFDCPGTLAAIHAEYIGAGVDILTANTFRTNVRALRAAGREAAGEELNRRAVEIARQATERHDRRALVAGSIAPVEDCYTPARVPSEDTLRREHQQMVTWLVAAGVDLVWIETMNTLREARIAAGAAAECDVPFVVSFVAAESGSVLGGAPVEEAVREIVALEPLAIGLNCVPPAGLTAILPRLRAATELPLVAYGHIGNAEPIPGWATCQPEVTPTEYAAEVRRWLKLGVRIVGGCCGTTPAHVRAVREVVDKGC